MDADLMTLVVAIVDNDAAAFDARLAARPELARAALAVGATRQASREFFLPAIGRYLMTGDTALHIAAAGYRVAMVERLLAAGADPGARNRRGAEPLHAAAAGQPGSVQWNPEAQAQVIGRLIAAGADPNAHDKSGTTPLHKAVRTRCASAVEALIAGGADSDIATKRGSTPARLAEVTSGRGGSGSPEARAEQAEILKRL
jgi:hypothetical protein